jgi:flagellar basal body-associated protein FliL
MIQEILDFLTDNTDESFFDLIKEDLKIEIDNELSSLYDDVNEKVIDVSFEDIVKAVINRVKIAISTFEE